MTAQDLSAFWQQGSDEAWKTVEALLEKERYAHAPYYCHLTLEKLLKARYVERCQHPAPPTHDLVWLLEQSRITFTDEDRGTLAEIAKFNIAGRYEDYKFELRHRATSDYTKTWVEQTARLRAKLAGRGAVP